MAEAWPWKSWLLVFLFLLIITGLQIVIGYLIVSTRAFGARPGMMGGRFAWLNLLSYLGLASPIGYYFSVAGSSAWINAAGTLPATLVTTAWHFLLPGYAAAAVARSRKHGDTGDLIAGGYSPGQVLLGKGVGRLAPLLVLAFACWLLSLLALPLVFGATIAMGGGVSANAGLRSGLLVSSLSMVFLTPLGWLLRAAIMVGLSALNRRVWHAISLCYVFELVLQPGVFYLVRTTLQKYWTSPADFWIPTLLSSGVMLAMEAALLAVLIPLALAALRQDAAESASVPVP
jgi:hypothetical protein